MRVTRRPPGKNEVDVVVYPDADTPAGRNFDPSPMMKVARWGNAGSTGGAEETPAACAHILHRGEGQGLLPRHEADYRRGNVATVLGEFPSSFLAQKPCNQEGDIGIYAKVGVFETIIQRDHLGRPKPQIVYRGQYDPGANYYDGTAFVDIEPQVRAELRALLRLPVALHQGRGKEPPVRGTPTDWSLYQGTRALRLEWAGSEDSVYEDSPEITLEVLAEIYHQDVTSDPKIKWDWTREKLAQRVAGHCIRRALERLPTRTGRQLAPPCEEDMNYSFGEAPRQAHLHSDRHAHRQERRGLLNPWTPGLRQLKNGTRDMIRKRSTQ